MDRIDYCLLFFPDISVNYKLMRANRAAVYAMFIKHCHTLLNIELNKNSLTLCSFEIKYTPTGRVVFGQAVLGRAVRGPRQKGGEVSWGYAKIDTGKDET